MRRLRASRGSDASGVVSTLDVSAQQVVAERLQPILVDLLELQLTGKQLHWTVVGPGFKPLHEHLDELVDEYREWSDDVAERLSAIGVPPDGRLVRVAGDSPADPPPDGWVAQDDVVSEMTARVEDVVRRTRTRLQGIGDVDPVSEDLVIEVLGGLEMQLWMLSAQRG